MQYPNEYSKCVSYNLVVHLHFLLYIVLDFPLPYDSLNKALSAFVGLLWVCPKSDDYGSRYVVFYRDELMFDSTHTPQDCRSRLLGAMGMIK